jgi:hypothetical protein
MVLTMVYDHPARLHSYDLLADLFDVQPTAEAAPSIAAS